MLVVTNINRSEPLLFWVFYCLWSQRLSLVIIFTIVKSALYILLIFNNRRFNKIKRYQMREKWNCMSTLLIIIFLKRIQWIVIHIVVYLLHKFIFYLNTKHFSKIYQENIFSQFHGKHKWKSESTYPHNFNTRNVVWNDYRKHTNLSAMWFKIPKINTNKFNNQLILLIVRLIIKRS